MADPYIDKYETILYGRFAASQAPALVVGLDPELDPTVTLMANRITAATDAMEAALKKAGDLALVTYTSAGATTADPVAEGRRLLRQAVAYANSRDDGDAIAADMLAGENLGTVVKRRPVKLAGALDEAIKGMAKHAAALPEHTAWESKLGAAKAALDTLNQTVRKAREDRRTMTPEIAAAREAWLVTYASAKNIIEGVLRGKGKLRLMSEVFDDLAEVHRVPGVTDESPAPEGGGAPAEPK